MHNSSVRSWADLPGDDFVVIGGYESGMDALYNLTMSGKKCTVASSTAFWKVATDDPSTELARCLVLVLPPLHHRDVSANAYTGPSSWPHRTTVRVSWKGAKHPRPPLWLWQLGHSGTTPWP